MSDDSSGGGGAEGGQPAEAADPAPETKDQTGEKPDAEPEESDRDHLGTESSDFKQAYRSGRVSLRGSGNTFVDAGGDVHVSETINLVVGRGGTQAPGPVRREVLELIRSNYTLVAEYDGIFQALIERKLVLLRGFPDTGRATTALRILDELAGGKVFRLDLPEDLTSLESKLETGGGYLIDHSGPHTGETLAEPQLDRLSSVLEDRDCLCVVLVDRQPGMFGGYLRGCTPPDPDTMLRRYISAEMRLDDPDGLEDGLLELAGQPGLRAALGPRPRPAETVALARLLVEHGRGAITLEDVEAGCAELVRRQIAEWFASLCGVRRTSVSDEALRLAGFRIALAVFNESPYHIVREAGEQLAREFMRTLWPKRAPGRSLTGDDGEIWLAAARAELVDGDMTKGAARIPVRMVKYQHDGFPRAVLSHVWLSHHNAREPVRRWLENQSRDPREFVWVRAAQAAGLLCALDFPYTFNNVIEPAAKSDQVVERQFAAVALDQAAVDDQIRPMISAYLKSWIRGKPELQLTVAHTLGFDVGLESIEDSLAKLRILGTRAETKPDMPALVQRNLFWYSGDSLARLFAAGASRPVLARLQEWIRPGERQSLQEFASWTIVKLAHLSVDDLRQSAAWQQRERRTPVAERKDWPVLLAMQEEDAELTAPVADLVRHALRSRRGQTAEFVLEGWLRAGDGDVSCLDALVRFLPRLVRNDGDRRRLRRLVGKMRRDWADPLDEDVALRLEETLDHLRILEVVQ